jgi:outer membrane protein OmpA-like peptidoglycan-associated protein
LIDGWTGQSYSDYLLAKTLYDGALSGQNVTYSLFGNLPAGISFSSTTGVLSGVVSKDAAVGFYPITVAAFANGYTTEVLNINWRILASAVVATPTPSPAATAAAAATPPTVLSILFTDTTLVKGIIGRTYTDYVQAKTFSGNVYTEERISYSLVGALPTGLTFSSSTGYISGIISNGVTPGVYKVLVSAFAKGYPTQIYPYDFTVVSALTIATTATPAPSATPTKTSTQSVSSKMILMDTLWFDSGKSLLTSASKASLDKMIKTLVASPYKTVVINGFTDAVKGKPHPTLSLARAKAVHTYILARTVGIKITSVGLGLAPSSANSSKSLQQSRKAEIWVA